MMHAFAIDHITTVIWWFDEEFICSNWCNTLLQILQCIALWSISTLGQINVQFDRVTYLTLYEKFQIICNTHRDWLQDNRIISLYRCPVSNLIGEQYVHFHLILSHRHTYDICDHYWNPPGPDNLQHLRLIAIQRGKIIGIIVQCQSCYHILIRIV